MRTPAQIEVAGEIDRLLIQAGAIAGLLCAELAPDYVRPDDHIQNAAWLLTDMLTRVQVLLQENESLARCEVAE